MAGALDFKKAYPDLYLPKAKPALIDVPAMTFIAVDGEGDPNEEDGSFSRAVDLLYGLSYTIKMSKMGGRAPDGYYEYVVPPLEGLWRTKSGAPGELDLLHKDEFVFTAMIRQPEFVTQAVFDAAGETVLKKKGLDPAGARLMSYAEGLSVQCMHLGPYDAEPATMARMYAFIEENGLAADYSDARRHHEIYLGDPRKTAPEKLRTVLRIPVRRA